MDNHASLFIDHEHVIVLEEDLKWNILRDQVSGHRRRDPDRDNGFVFQRLTRLLRRVLVHINKTICDQALDTRT
jgi:hypothetical protein